MYLGSWCLLAGYIPPESRPDLQEAERRQREEELEAAAAHALRPGTAPAGDREPEGSTAAAGWIICNQIHLYTALHVYRKVCTFSPGCGIGSTCLLDTAESGEIYRSGARFLGILVDCDVGKGTICSVNAAALKAEAHLPGKKGLTGAGRCPADGQRRITHVVPSRRRLAIISAYGYI